MLPIGTLSPVPPMHPAFGVTPTFYIPPSTLIQRPDDMLSSPLGQHILDYEPLHGFVIPAFPTFDDSVDPYDHMLHYNQTMIVKAGNDRLLCKVFLASLRGSALAWFHKLPRYSINLFNKLWVTFISQYLCLYDKRETSASYKLFSNRKKSQFVTSQGGSGKPSSK